MLTYCNECEHFDYGIGIIDGKACFVSSCEINNLSIAEFSEKTPVPKWCPKMKEACNGMSCRN